LLHVGLHAEDTHIVVGFSDLDETLIAPPGAPRVLNGPEGGCSFRNLVGVSCASFYILAGLLRFITLVDPVAFFHCLSAILLDRASLCSPLVDGTLLVLSLPPVRKCWVAIFASPNFPLISGSSSPPAGVLHCVGAALFVRLALARYSHARALICALGWSNFSAVNINPLASTFWIGALLLPRASFIG